MISAHLTNTVEGNASENEDWCLDIDEYIQLPSFGQSNHPVMYNPENMDNEMIDAIRNAMLSWGDEMWVEEYPVEMKPQMLQPCEPPS